MFFEEQVIYFGGAFFFRAATVAYGGSQARGPIRAVAAGLYHSSWQRRILNPLSRDRDQTRNLMVPRWIHFHCAIAGTPEKQVIFVFDF